MQKVKVDVWDLPTRIFHWALAICVFAAIATGLVGGEWIELHAKIGIFIVGLIVFRLVLGFIGGYYSRFLQFFPTPSSLCQYLKGKWKGLGHNPFGAFSVFALLGLVSFQSISGLFTNDDISLYGPLYQLVSKETSDFITDWHTTIVYVLMAFIGLHIAAIMFYRIFKKDNLVKPMVIGYKEIEGGDANKAAIDENMQNQHRIKCGVAAMIIALVVAIFAVFAASGKLIKPAETTQSENQTQKNGSENSQQPQSQYDW